VSFPFVKGHGTRNDFIVLPDFDGSLHGDLDPQAVAALCDRRSGIGADGVLRAIRTHDEAPWFMDYRNADGSISEMCGNGVRVFALYLRTHGLIDDIQPVPIDTRDGLRWVTFCADGEISVDMGVATVGSQVKIAVEGRSYSARAVDVGNPHAVAIVESLAEAGTLRVTPQFDDVDFPQGVNIEFVVRREPGRLAMRVFERGVGETQSCGTGACAVAAVALAEDGESAAVTYEVAVPGGLLTVTRDQDHHLHLKGPAVLVAEGHWLS
jgi:diaminopimelate epimerase